MTSEFPDIPLTCGGHLRFERRRSAMTAILSNFTEEPLYCTRGLIGVVKPVLIQKGSIFETPV